MSLDQAASTAGADVNRAGGNADTAVHSLTDRQQFWLDHLRRCDADRIPTKTYAQRHGLSVQAMYSARKALVERGLLPTGGRKPGIARFTRVSTGKPAGSVAAGPTGWRIHLSNGAVVSFEGPLDDSTLHQVLQAAATLP